MTTFDIASNIDEQVLRLGYAQAILTEIFHKTAGRIEPNTGEASLLIENFEHLNDLISATEMILDSVAQGCSKLSDDLMEIYKGTNEATGASNLTQKCDLKSHYPAK